MPDFVRCGKCNAHLYPVSFAAEPGAHPTILARSILRTMRLHRAECPFTVEGRIRKERRDLDHRPNLGPTTLIAVVDRLLLVTEAYQPPNGEWPTE